MDRSRGCWQARPMAELRLIQVYYEDAQRARLDPVAVAHCNVQLSAIFENQVILDRLRAGDHLQADYWGLSSWRMGEKTGLTVAALRQCLHASQGRFDAYTYDGIARGSELADNRHNAIGALIGRLQRLHGLIEDRRWVPVFCNYWFATSAVCSRYLRLLEQLHHSVQQDRQCQALLQQGVLQHRDRERSLHAFIYEYFFGLFLRNSPDLRVGQVYRMAGADGSQQPRVLQRVGAP